MAPTTVPVPPRLREDLVVRRLDTPEGARFVLKDPGTGGFFRLGEAEYAVARRLDGAASLESVAAAASEEMGFQATAAEIAPFVEQLGRRGLLAGPDARPAPARRRRVSGPILYLRFAAFDPDRLLSRLVGPARFLYTPWFVGGGALLVVGAFLTTLANGPDIAADVARLWRFQSLLLVWLTILGSTALHEMSHGLTCKRFGGEVREMGFMLIYFQPAFYCNVSDAYLFPQKSRRLWVTAAGAYCDLLLWALATFAWRVVERDTWISSLALVVVATCGVRTFFNLNPLIMLDGYYLLTDLVEVPNLRSRAFAHVGARIRKLLGGGGTVPEASPRERRIFVLYGLFAGVFSYWLLSSVLLALGGYVTWKYQAWGFVMISALVGATFRRPLTSFFRSFGSRAWVSGKARAAALGGVALGGLAILPVDHTPSGEFDLLPGNQADARSGIEGVLAEVYVDEGTRVAAQDPVARIFDEDLRARVAMASARIAELQARLAQLRAGTRPEELDVARVAVRKSEARLAHAQAVLECTRKCADAGAASRLELEQSIGNATLRAHELEEARSNLTLLEAGSRPEEIAVVEQQIARERAECEFLEADLARAIVRAPHAGVVTTPRLREKVGQLVKRGDLIAEVRDVDTLTADVRIPEREIEAVRAGMEATLRFRAHPDRAFAGTVAEVAPAALDVGSRDGRIVRVSIQVPNADGVLRPQLTGYARIHTGDRSALDLMTRGVRRFARLEFWSWW